MKCHKCEKGLFTGTPLFRINPKGEEGKWACSIHLPPENQDEETITVVAMIESAIETKH